MISGFYSYDNGHNQIPDNGWSKQEIQIRLKMGLTTMVSQIPEIHMKYCLP